MFGKTKEKAKKKAAIDSLSSLGVDYIPTDNAKNIDGGVKTQRDTLFGVIDSGVRLKVPVRLTPELAAQFLARNNDNIRNMNKTRVREVLAPDVAAGNWVPYNAVIAFDGQGRLKNGQHTCQAVIEGRQAITVWVQTGITREQEMVIDNCSPRQAYHAIEGMNKNSQAVLKAMLEHVSSIRSGSNHSLTNYWEQLGADINHTLTIRSGYEGKPDDAIFHSALATAIHNGVDPDDVKSFLEQVFGETTWLQASQFRNALSKNYYKGYTQKAKYRRFKLTLMVLQNYLDGVMCNVPRVDAVDKFDPKERWEITIN